MNAVILAAGYATRLYPLTQDFPKPLLQVGQGTILDHLLDQMESIAALERIVLVTNHRFLHHFEQWRTGRAGRREGVSPHFLKAENGDRPRKPVVLLDDGTTGPDDRLGAVGDLRFALEQMDLDDDLLVAAADNILRFPLADFVTAFQSRRASQVCVHWLDDPQRQRRTGIALLGADDRVLEFAEKPAEPKSNWAVPPLYLFPRAALRRLGDYFTAGGAPDAPGHFIAWLCHEEPVYAWRMSGAILDIGTPASLAAARELYRRG